MELHFTEIFLKFSSNTECIVSPTYRKLFVDLPCGKVRKEGETFLHVI